MKRQNRREFDRTSGWPSPEPHNPELGDRIVIECTASCNNIIDLLLSGENTYLGTTLHFRYTSDAAKGGEGRANRVRRDGNANMAGKVGGANREARAVSPNDNGEIGDYSTNSESRVDGSNTEVRADSPNIEGIVGDASATRKRRDIGHGDARVQYTPLNSAAHLWSHWMRNQHMAGWDFTVTQKKV